MESYHTGNKFGAGPRNEPRVPKSLPPALSAPGSPELRRARLRQLRLLSLKRETPHHRVSHQSLVASELLLVGSLRIWGGRPCRKPIFLPPSGPPRVFPELWKLPSRESVRLLSLNGKQLAAVCRIKALWRLRCCALPVCGFEEGDRLATNQNFYPRLSRPGFSRVEAFA